MPRPKPTRDAHKQLTPKEAVFVEEYLVDLNVAGAAKRAGYESSGFAVIRRPPVTAAIEARMADRIGRLEVSQDRVIRELELIAYGDLRDAATWGANGVTFRESAALSDDVARTISEVHQSEQGALKIKRADKMAALTLLGKHLGMFIEKTEAKHDITVRVEYAEEDDAR